MEGDERRICTMLKKATVSALKSGRDAALDVP
jgi:hypothetical protein